MSRAPRIEGEGLWYHVYNRGNEKRDIFVEERDYRLFLNTLFHSCEQYDVEVHAFVLMKNHFHAMLRTVHANLCRCMHSMMSNFTRRYNAAHDRVGHVFQGRYRAIVVDNETYGRELLRYIHLNPVRGARAAGLDIASRLAEVRSYQWSSHAAYAGLTHCPWPVVTAELLQLFGASPGRQRREYLRFLADGLSDTTNVFDHVLGKAILGSESFVARVKTLVRHGHKDASAAPERRRIAACSIDDVLAAVCEEYGVTPELLTRRYPRPEHHEARRVLIWAAARYCRGSMPLMKLGARLGGVTGGMVSNACKNVERASITSPDMARKLIAVSQRLDKHLSDDIAGVVPVQWWQMYQQLVEYHRRHGHVNVPHDCREHTVLAAWVARQRRLLREGSVDGASLSAMQVELLKRLKLA